MADVQIGPLKFNISKNCSLTKHATTNGSEWPWLPLGCLSSAVVTLGLHAFLPMEKSSHSGPGANGLNLHSTSKTQYIQGLLPDKSSQDRGGLLALSSPRLMSHLHLNHWGYVPQDKNLPLTLPPVFGSLYLYHNHVTVLLSFQHVNCSHTMVLCTLLLRLKYHHVLSASQCPKSLIQFGKKKICQDKNSCWLSPSPRSLSTKQHTLRLYTFLSKLHETLLVLISQIQVSNICAFRG